MNYALLGLGFISNRHIESINEIGSNVICTCDNDISKNATFLDYRKMLKDKIMESVDIISILTPNYLHAEHIRACLNINKKVLVEKPLTITTDFSFMDGVYVVHQLHFHPLFNEICSAIKNAKKIKAVMRAYRDSNFWNSWKGDEQKSGGVIYVLGSHIFDLILSAISNNYILKDIIDTNKKSTGKIIFDNGQEVEFLNEFLDSRDSQDRYIECDDKKYQLSIKDNLSFEGLHPFVLKAIESGMKSNLNNSIKYVELIDRIKKYENL